MSNEPFLAMYKGSREEEAVDKPRTSLACSVKTNHGLLVYVKDDTLFISHAQNPSPLSSHVLELTESIQ